MNKVSATLLGPDGVQKEYAYQVEDDFTEHDAIFMWEDGNFACDCNRSIFLYGRDLDEAAPCSTNEATIQCVSLKWNGAEIYAEGF